MMRRSPALTMSLGLSLAVLAAAACGDDDDDGGGSTTSEATNPPSGSGGEDARVTVRDNEFDPAEVSVGVNHEVTCEWEGNNPHSIVGTFEGEDVQFPRLTGSGTFVF